LERPLKEQSRINLATKYFHTHAQSRSKGMTLPSKDPDFDLATYAR
jgi:hypothetical protein